MNDIANLKGLTDAEVAQSRLQHGINVLTPPRREPVWKKFLAKFRDPLIVILSVAAVLSVGISCYEYWGLGKESNVFFEPFGIIMAIFLATGLAFIFEQKADKEFLILNQVNDDEPVRVLRNGITIEIARRDVVVGDIVYLNTGDEVPADGVLLECVSLTMDESTLTGEPSCHKTTDAAAFDAEATYPSDKVLRGTKVMEGHGVFVVEAVGDATENGKVFEEAQIDDSVRTPLNEQLDRLGNLITKVSYTISALVIAGRCLMYYCDPSFVSFFNMDFGAYFLQSIMIAVTLMVVSIPEGLPMAVTVSLAYSMRRMLKTKNLVRRMHACETMGAATVICTDKTGTLTQNKMQVAEMVFPPMLDMDIVREGIAVNSTATLDMSGELPKVLGNPTEGALLLWLHGTGADYQELRRRATSIAELPFNTERKFMASVVTSGVTGKRVLYVKGAPEIVMGLADTVAGGMSRDELQKILLDFQQHAMRTLGFAYKELVDGEEPIVDGGLSVTGLTFLGVAAISDPVRDDVPAAVAECRKAGIEVKIVTGDTPSTAREIGRRIGIFDNGMEDGTVVTGPEFAALPDSELSRRVSEIKIIARARPSDKKRLVEALQRNNEVVAVTGDGTNDAPALKTAHVGLSMGDGTSVAKESSDITIIDNSFSSIGRAVMWGRSLYNNIQRFILFQLTVNVVACLIVLAGAFMGTETPLTVTQMLWVNLIMDTFAAMALASLPANPAVMNDKPRRRSDFIINRGMWRFILGTGCLFCVFLLGLLYVFEHGDIVSLTDLLHLHIGQRNALTPYELSLFFTIFVFLQFWNMFNARAFMTGRSALHFKGCGEFLFIAAFIFVGQIAIIEIGGQFFNVVPLSLHDWIVIIGGTSVVLWAGEFLRLFRKKTASIYAQDRRIR